MAVPVGLVNQGPEAAREISASDFELIVGKTTSPVKSLATDEGPRSIVLVIDRTKKLSADMRESEQLIVETLLALSRPEDQFALITARGSQKAVPFTRDHAVLLQGLKGDGESPAGTENGVLDAVLKAVGMFESSAPGDAIIVIAKGLDGHNKTRDIAVAKALLQHRIRLFGLALGPVARTISHGMTVMSGPNSTTISTDFSYGDQTFFPLTMVSGGFVVDAMNGKPDHRDKLKDPAIEARIRKQTKSIFDLVRGFYRIDVEVPQPGPWRLHLSEAVRKAAPGLLVLYPRELWPCSSDLQKGAAGH